MTVMKRITIPKTSIKRHKRAYVARPQNGHKPSHYTHITILFSKKEILYTHTSVEKKGGRERGLYIIRRVRISKAVALTKGMSVSVC